MYESVNFGTTELMQKLEWRSKSKRICRARVDKVSFWLRLMLTFKCILLLLQSGLFLAALAALYLTLVSESVTHSLSATFEFWHKEWLLTLQTLQTFDQSDVWTKRQKDKNTKGKIQKDTKNVRIVRTFKSYFLLSGLSMRFLMLSSQMAKIFCFHLTNPFKAFEKYGFNFLGKSFNN